MTILKTIEQFTSARRVARLLHKIQRQYEGRNVIEVLPNGKEVAAKIVKMDWESSIGLEGDWSVLVEYVDSGYRSWTDCTVLRLI